MQHRDLLEKRVLERALFQEGSKHHIKFLDERSVVCKKLKKKGEIQTLKGKENAHQAKKKGSPDSAGAAPKTEKKAVLVS